MALKVYTRDMNRAVRLESHISGRSVDVSLIFKAPDAEKRMMVMLNVSGMSESETGHAARV